jgi:hypothetical protein
MSNNKNEITVIDAIFITCGLTVAFCATLFILAILCLGVFNG